MTGGWVSTTVSVLEHEEVRPVEYEVAV